MDTWVYFRDRMALPWFEMKYESLVTNMEDETRALLSFLGEPWDENVMNYYKVDTGRSVMTPSYLGVTRPTYTSSIGRWQNYEKHMEPYLPALAPYLKIFGYTEE